MKREATPPAEHAAGKRGAREARPGAAPDDAPTGERDAALDAIAPLPGPVTPPPAVAEQLAHLPDRPGVYIYRDAAGTVLYVGKATSLRSRVRSYWHASRSGGPRIAALLQRVASLETIVCENPVEALVLESNLIKLHRPRYNVRLRDDKQYPWLRIDPREDWPRLTVVRSRRDDGARYFGPYTHSTAVRETLGVLRRAFPYRTCSDRRLARGGRPCLYYHIGRCPAPCVGYVTKEEYGRTVQQLVDFLGGQDASVLRELEAEMEAASEELAFERAAELRDRIRALKAVRENQNAVLRRVADRDLVALASEGDVTAAQVFFVREGRVEGRASFTLTSGVGSEEEALAAFLQQYYGGGAAVPKEVLVARDLPAAERETLESYLASLRGGRVAIRRPLRGESRALMDLVVQNARQRLDEEIWRRDRARRDAGAALAELQEELDLPEPPRRIECYDVSNTQGSHIVAAMTVAEDGRPVPREYRKFRIQTVRGAPDDFRSMREVLSRRFRRALAEMDGDGDGDGAAEGANGGALNGGAPAGDRRWSRLPDLIIIDGGRGQLSAAMEVLAELGLDGIPTFGLAKEEEWLFRPGSPDPIVLPKDSPALHLLQQVRDEAHRFGITYHRSLRSRGALRSLLDDVPGIGPKRRRALQRAFGSAEAVVAAGVEAVAALPGFSTALAERVVERIREEIK